MKNYQNSFTDDELREMITGDNPQSNSWRELLAYREAQGKIVAYISERNLKNLGKQFSVYVKHEPVMVRPIPLFTAPQLPAVPVKYSRAQGVFDGEWEMGYESGWNACRAAMSKAP